MNVPRKPLSKRRSRRRKSLPTSGCTVASSASILPAQSTASARRPGRAARRRPARGARATAASTAYSSRVSRRSSRRGRRPSAVVRNANGSVPGEHRAAPPPMRPRLRNLRRWSSPRRSLAPSPSRAAQHCRRPHVTSSAATSARARCRGAARPPARASGPCRRRWASVACSVPRSNTHSVPGVPCCHSSSRVSGSVATTATRSRALVTAEKSICISASRNVARPNGALRTM